MDRIQRGSSMEGFSHWIRPYIDILPPFSTSYFQTIVSSLQKLVKEVLEKNGFLEALKHIFYW